MTPRHARRRAPSLLLAGAAVLLAVPATASATTGAATAADPSATLDDPIVAGEPEPTEAPAPRTTTSTSPVVAAAEADGLLDPRVAGTLLPDPDVVLTGSGWGHGVGLSQYGAYAQALAGRSAAQILQHYYTGVRVEQRDVEGTSIRVGLFTRGQGTATRLEARGGAVRWEACSAANRCGDVIVDGKAALVQPAGTTWRATLRGGQFAVTREDGSTVTIDTSAARLQAVPGPGATLVGMIPTTGGSDPGPTVPFPDGFHELVRVGATYHVVHELPLGPYLQGLAEVPSSWGINGPAALEAQAIAGRTYALRMRGSGAERDWCSCHLLSTPRNQNWTAGAKAGSAFGSLWVDAVRASAGRVVVTAGGDFVETYYSSSHGGRSEAVEDSWAYGRDPVPYLRSVDDPWSTTTQVGGIPVGNPNVLWKAPIANDTLSSYLDDRLERITRVRVSGRTDGGTPVALVVDGVGAGGAPLRVVWQAPSTSRKQIAGANLRIDIRDTGSNKLKSSQISRFGFAPFTDDDGGVHEYAIVFAVEAGLTKGLTETEFGPGRAVTRGQMASFLDRMLALEPAEEFFPDVPSDGTHADAIGAITAAGIASGYADGTYRPNRPVTRGEMATLLAGALRLPQTDPDGRFDDVGTGVHAPAITAVADAGITLGCGDGSRFCPDDPVTRAEMAQFLFRSVEFVRS